MRVTCDKSAAVALFYCILIRLLTLSCLLQRCIGGKLLGRRSKKCEGDEAQFLYFIVFLAFTISYSLSRFHTFAPFAFSPKELFAILMLKMNDLIIKLFHLGDNNTQIRLLVSTNNAGEKFAGGFCFSCSHNVMHLPCVHFT